MSAGAEHEPTAAAAGSQAMWWVGVRRAAPALITALLGVVLLWSVRPVLPPFIIALFLAALLDPVVSRVERRGVSRARVVASIFGLALLAVVIGVTLIVPPVVAQVTDLAAHVTDYAQNVTEAVGHVTERADRWYEDHRRTLGSLGMTEKPSEYLRKQAGPISAGVREFLDSVRATIAGLLGQVLWLIIVPVSLFYFLLDYRVLRKRIIGLLPVSGQDDAERMVQEVIEIFGAYVRGLAKVCFMYGATAAVLFWILRLRYALFLGTAAGVFYAVPYVGPALSVASLIILSVTTGNTFGYTAVAVVLFVLMHVSFDYGVTPRVVGGSVGLHPLVNIFALMCGVTLFGVWGMILAVPVAASIQRILLHIFPKLGSTAPASAAPSPADLSAENSSAA